MHFELRIYTYPVLFADLVDVSVLSTSHSSLVNLTQTVLQIEWQRVMAPPEDLNIN
jgi:hypothetical protein